MEEIENILRPFIKIPSLINIDEKEAYEILSLGDNIEYEEFEDFSLFSNYLNYEGLIILVYANEGFELKTIEDIEKIFDKKYGLKYLIGSVVHSNPNTKYGVITVKNTSKKFNKTNYLLETRKLIKELEDPLVEIEKVLIELNKLNLDENQKEVVLNRLKTLGDIIEPRKGKIQTL